MLDSEGQHPLTRTSTARAKKEAVDSEVHQHIVVSPCDCRQPGESNNVHLSAGNFHDSGDADVSLSAVPLEGTIMLADKAYGSRAIRDFITASGASYCIQRCSEFSVRGLL